MTAVRSLCKRAVLLRSGKVVLDDSVEEVVRAYQTKDIEQSRHRKWKSPEKNHSDKYKGIYLKEAKIVFSKGHEEPIRVNDCFELAFCIHSEREAKINLSPHYLGVGGEVLFAAPSPSCEVKRGDNWFFCHVPGDLLNDGLVSVQLMVVENSQAIQVVNEALVIEIQDLPRDGAWLGRWPGVIRPKFAWRTQ